MFENGFPKDWSTLTKLIWTKKIAGGGSPIPGYKTLDYIHFGGNSYIGTGCKIDQDHAWIGKWRKTSTSNMYLYGYTNSGNTITTTAYLTSSSGNWRFGAKTASITTSANTWYESVQDKSGVTLNGNKTAYASQSDFSTTYNMYLGVNRTSNGSTGTNFFVGDVAYFKVTNNGVLVLDLVPVKRLSDNVYGFYDLDDGGFYPAVGDPFTGSDSPIVGVGTADNMILLDSEGEITPNASQSLNMLLGGMYTNNHTADDVSDEEALNIILGGDNE